MREKGRELNVAELECHQSVEFFFFLKAKKTKQKLNMPTK